MKIPILLACLMGAWLLTGCHTPPPPVAANPKLQETADGCIKNLQLIGVAAAMYADKNDRRLPATWTAMKNFFETNHFGSPQLLVCPSQGSAPTNWNDFNTNMVTYQMVAPGWVRSNAESGLVVYLYCPEHHFYLMGDGSIHTNESKSFIWPKRMAALLSATKPKGSIDFNGVSTEQALDFYADISGFKLVVDSRVHQLHEPIYLHAAEVSKNEMKKLVKKALLQQAGIVIASLGDNRVSVTYNDALPITQHHK